MASAKKLNRQLKAKREIIGAEKISAQESPDTLNKLEEKDKKIARAIISTERQRKKITKKAFIKNQRHVPPSKKPRAINKPDFIREFDEFGAIIFKVNADDIFLSLPDFDKKFIIEKSNNYSYEKLITDTVIKTAINSIREKKLNRPHSKFSLNKAIPSINYDDLHPTIDIQTIDAELLDIEPPAYTFISLNIKSICEHACKSLKPMSYKAEVYLYNKTSMDKNEKKDPIADYLSQSNIEIIFETETDRLITKIQENHSKSLFCPSAA